MVGVRRPRDHSTGENQDGVLQLFPHANMGSSRPRVPLPFPSITHCIFWPAEGTAGSQLPLGSILSALSLRSLPSRWAPSALLLVVVSGQWAAGSGHRVLLDWSWLCIGPRGRPCDKSRHVISDI